MLDGCDESKAMRRDVTDDGAITEVDCRRDWSSLFLGAGVREPLLVLVETKEVGWKAETAPTKRTHTADRKVIF
jgi:hypothetical protein